MPPSLGWLGTRSGCDVIMARNVDAKCTFLIWLLGNFDALQIMSKLQQGYRLIFPDSPRFRVVPSGCCAGLVLRLKMDALRHVRASIEAGPTASGKTILRGVVLTRGARVGVFRFRQYA